MPPGASKDVALTLQQYLESRLLRYGQRLWRLDEPAEEMFILEKGSIRVTQHRSGLTSDVYAVQEQQATSDIDEPSSAASEYPTYRSFELGPGCVGGSTDFFLARQHRTQAVCSSPVARVLCLSRQSLGQLAAEVPQVLAVLELVIMRANTLDLTVAAELGLNIERH